MPQTIRLETPDHIELEFHLAGLGSRSLAVLLDHIIQAIVVITASLVAAQLLSLVEASSTAFTLALLVVVLFVVWGYFFLFEWLWNGLTPGKRALGIRVMRDDGRPLDAAGSAIRNIVRLVDFLPTAYGFGILAVFFNGQSKRLGDLAAGTIVVTERKLQSAPLSPLVAEPPRVVERGLIGLSVEDRQVALRFLDRRQGLGAAQRSDLAARLAQGLAQKAGLDPQSVLDDPERFLSEVAASE